MKNRLLICLFIFLVLRIAFSYFTGWKEIPPGSDAISFNSYALAILDRTDWLTNPDFYGNYREPG